MIKPEKIFGPATPELLDPQYVIAVVRYNEKIQWLLSDHDNFVLDFRKWRDEFVAAGHQVPDPNAAATQRSGIVVVDQNTVEAFLSAPEVHKLNPQFLRQALLERFPSAKSWWDVGFLFPIAFIDFDHQRLGAFYHHGPRLERYVPDGWVGEFTDFATTYPEAVFPASDKFWIVEGRNLLNALNDRGRALEVARAKT